MRKTFVLFALALTALAYAACALLPFSFAVPALLVCVLLAAFHVLPGDAPPADKVRSAAALVFGVVYVAGALSSHAVVTRVGERRARDRNRRRRAPDRDTHPSRRSWAGGFRPARLPRPADGSRRCR